MKEITKALIKFHNEVGAVAKNSTNPYFKSKYGDLNAYLEVIKQPLCNAGLAFVQCPIENGLKTILMHESGEFIESEIKMQFPTDIQKIGACITYLRRYSLSAILGLYAEDDDGNSAVEKKEDKAREKLIEAARNGYKQVPQPNEALTHWISTVDTLTNEEIVKGIGKINKLINK
jgi:hypothetical protein